MCGNGYKKILFPKGKKNKKDKKDKKGDDK